MQNLPASRYYVMIDDDHSNAYRPDEVDLLTYLEAAEACVEAIEEQDAFHITVKEWRADPGHWDTAATWFDGEQFVYNISTDEHVHIASTIRSSVGWAGRAMPEQAIAFRT